MPGHLAPGELTDTGDVEKQDTAAAAAAQPSPYKKQRASFLSMLKSGGDGEVYGAEPDKNPKWLQKIIDFGVEDNGIKPVPLEQRTEKRVWNLGTVMCSALLNLLP